MKFFLLRPCMLVLAVVAASTPLLSQESATWRELVTDLDTPWEILNGPGNTIWYTQRNGNIGFMYLDSEFPQDRFVIDDVAEKGEAGLMGMAIYDMGSTQWYYVAYASAEHSDVRIVRYTTTTFSWNFTDSTVILTGLPVSTNHVGCRLLIVDDKLFITFGDALEPSAAQDLTKLNGKIFRLNLDGSVPEDNPWADKPFPQNLIWSYGHRNPQGIVFGPNGILYSSEHGPDTDDEVNIIEAGRNYGWPNVEGYCDTRAEIDFCEKENVMEPIMAWTPTLAVAGLDFYNSDTYPEWKNSLLLTTLKENDLRILHLDKDGRKIDDEKVYFDRQLGRIRDVCVTPDGRVFLATSNRDGRGSPGEGDDRIVEIYPAGYEPVIGDLRVDDAVICSNDTVVVHFRLSGNFPEDLYFTVELSDTNGVFTPGAPKAAAFPVNDSTVEATFAQIVPNVHYRMRLRVEIPNVVSDPLDGTITFTEAPNVTLESYFGILCGTESSVVLTAKPVPGMGKNLALLWSTGDTTTSITVDEPGPYSVLVTDENGCSTRSFPATVARVPQPTVEVEASSTTICGEDSVVLAAQGTGGSYYQWSTGATSQEIVVSDSGLYWVEYRNAQGCVARSDDIRIAAARIPSRPVIYRMGDVLISTVAAGYQWLRNDEPIPGAVEREYEVTETGVYTVIVNNEAGCERLSDPVEVQISGVPYAEKEGAFLTVTPLPVGDRMRIRFGRELYGRATISVSNIRGERVFSVEEMLNGTTETEVSLDGLAAGAYLLVVEAGSDRWEKPIVKR